MDDKLAFRALEARYITADQLAEAEEESQSLADRGVERSIVFILQDLGYLSDEQLGTLRRQTSSARIRALNIEGYTLQGRVGRGGMGDVFKGRDKDGNIVAVKVLPKKFLEDQEYIQRFHRECRMLKKLKHPYITAYHSSGEQDGRPYCIMEIVSGKSLKQYITEHGRMKPEDVLVLLRQMVEALQYAWEFGIIHRDVKPSNIIIGPAREGFDEPFCAKLCDFGLAKAVKVGEEETGTLTKSGMAVGTPHYMSPEAATGADIIAPCIDIYSLGATCYHALTGHTLYTGKSSAVIMYKQATQKVSESHSKMPEIHPELRKLLLEMLEKDRSHRFSEWSEVEKIIAGIELKVSSAQLAAIEADIESFSVEDPKDESGSGVPSSAQDELSGLEQPRTWAVMHLIILFVTILALGTGLVLLILNSMGQRQELVATPETFSVRLLEAERLLADNELVTIVLEEGEYVGPWDFTPAHNHLLLRTNGEEVRVKNDDKHRHPVLSVGSYVKNLRLHGIHFVGAHDAAVIIGRHAQCSLRALQISGSAQYGLYVAGAQIDIEGAYISGRDCAVFLETQSEFSLKDSLLDSAKVGLDATQAQLSLERIQISLEDNDHTEVALRVRQGRVIMQTVAIDAPGAQVGLVLDHTEYVQMRDIAVRKAQLGVHSYAAHYDKVFGVSIDADLLGFRQEGQWKGEVWTELRIDAPNLLDDAQGVAQIQNDGFGADPKALQLIPSKRDMLGQGH